MYMKNTGKMLVETLTTELCLKMSPKKCTELDSLGHFMRYLSD